MATSPQEACRIVRLTGYQLANNLGYQPKGIHMKYGTRNLNWFEAIVNKMGGEQAADAFLRDELRVSASRPAWHEEDGVVYFNVTSDGTSGEAWIARLEEKGFVVSDDAKSVLLSSDFMPTSGVTTRIEVLKGSLFTEAERKDSKLILIKGEMRGLSLPDPEVSCLIREKISDEDMKIMGLQFINTMHESIQGADGKYYRLCSNYTVQRGNEFSAGLAFLDDWWENEGFAFACILPNYFPAN